ncbi:MAG: hypothetical protein IH989_04010 [Planctomycetes bacterium]|nr:hypothetical protein [Planctomycetota bacterium]
MTTLGSATVRTVWLLLLLVACSQAPAPTAAPTPALTVSPTPKDAGVATGNREMSRAWRQLAPLPSARSEVAVAALRGQVYVIGGLASNGRTTNRVEAYDPESDAWVERAGLPLPLHHAAAASVGGRLLVLGGFGPGFAPVDTVFEYDPEADAWSKKASMPTARGALAAAVVDGRVYAVGGVTEATVIQGFIAHGNAMVPAPVLPISAKAVRASRSTVKRNISGSVTARFTPARDTVPVTVAIVSTVPPPSGVTNSTVPLRFCGAPSKLPPTVTVPFQCVVLQVPRSTVTMAPESDRAVATSRRPLQIASSTFSPPTPCSRASLPSFRAAWATRSKASCDSPPPSAPSS